MGPRLAALPFLALVLGAVDTLLVRREFDHRPLQVSLFWQSVLLWLAFGAVALIPSTLFARFLRRRRGRRDEPESPAAAVAGLAAWMAGPVLVHARVDRHTGIGADLSGLLTLGAVLDLALALGAAAALFLACRFALDRWGGLWLGAASGALALAAGLLVAFRDVPGMAPVAPVAPVAAEGGGGAPTCCCSCGTRRARRASRSTVTGGTPPRTSIGWRRRRCSSTARARPRATR